MYGLEVYRAEIIQADERTKAKARELDKLAPAIKAYHEAVESYEAAQNMDGRGANDEIARAGMALMNAGSALLVQIKKVPGDML